MNKESVLKQIEDGLVVSCQARKGWAMYGTDIMVAFANAAKEGGAVGIRATEPQNISAIKTATGLPMIGINKKWYDGYDVYITPTYESAEEIIIAGADIVALDGTSRQRPAGETLKSIVKQINENYPNTLIMADCDSVASACYAEACGVDIVSTTLVGYTKETEKQADFNAEVIADMVAQTRVPVIAEGHILTPCDLTAAFKAGAYSAVVGTAITRPEVITKNFVKQLEIFHQEGSI